jgi:KaiC/GvpD/RAD55 family RecA-like ATPase
MTNGKHHDPIPTGIEGLDPILGGFHVGDNVILEVGVPTPPHSFLDAIIEAAIGRGDRVHYIAFDASAATLRNRLARFGDKVTLVDCFRHGKDASSPGDAVEDAVVVEMPQYPDEFRRVIEGLARPEEHHLFIIDSLSGMAMLWEDEDRVARFYAQICPRLFDQGDIAVWVLHRGVHTPAFHAKIGHIAQVVVSLDLHAGVPSLVVERAVGRTDPKLRRPIPYREVDGRFGLVG